MEYLRKHFLSGDTKQFQDWRKHHSNKSHSCLKAPGSVLNGSKIGNLQKEWGTVYGSEFVDVARNK